jgi:lysophospholipase L1-like esterase
MKTLCQCLFRFKQFLCCSFASFCAIVSPGFSAESSSSAVAQSDAAPAVFMIGDSTMADKPLVPPQPERGWGQLLALYFKDEVQIVNLAVNGRSSKSFRDEGRWEPVMERIRPGDYVIIQFGHNDEKEQDPTRYTEPFGSFTQNLERYIRETREKGGIPVLATPVVRRSFDSEGKLRDTHGDYPEAFRRVASAHSVPLLELERESRDLIQKLGDDLSKRMFMWVDLGEYDTLPEGRKDDTHFNAYGASRICDLAAEEIREKVPELASWLR